MVQDIGYLLFKEVLGMSEYPGGVFSGVILKDLVMFFLIPTIFIILVIYMLLARLVPIDSKGMRLLVGIGAYLFIVFGGYYSIFARFAGPYFIFLIFILGLLYFLLSHFRGGGGGYTAKTGGGYDARSDAAASAAGTSGAAIGGVRGSIVDEAIDTLITLREKQNAIENARRYNDQRLLPSLESETAGLRAKLGILEKRIRYNPILNAEYTAAKAIHHVK